MKGHRKRKASGVFAKLQHGARPALELHQGLGFDWAWLGVDLCANSVAACGEECRAQFEVYAFNQWVVVKVLPDEVMAVSQACDGWMALVNEYDREGASYQDLVCFKVGCIPVGVRVQPGSKCLFFVECACEGIEIHLQQET